MSYQDILHADRRMMILRALAQTSGYGANRALLRDFLDSCGHVISADLLDAEVSWLAEMGLVALHDEAVLLSARGADVAAGRATVPGVRRARAGE